MSKKRMSKKYRKQRKKELANRKAKRQPTLIVDIAEPEEVKQMLIDAGIPIEETQIVEPDASPVSPARRAFGS